MRISSSFYIFFISSIFNKLTAFKVKQTFTPVKGLVTWLSIILKRTEYPILSQTELFINFKLQYLLVTDHRSLSVTTKLASLPQRHRPLFNRKDNWQIDRLDTRFYRLKDELRKQTFLIL